MAKTDGTVEAHLHTPANPLSRGFVTEGNIVAPYEESLTTLTGMLMGMHTLIRVLSTSEAFRGQCDCNDEQPVEDTPFDPMTTEGLFTALYFLSERAEMVAGALLDKQEASHP
jgi:hypothetical protein